MSPVACQILFTLAVAPIWAVRLTEDTLPCSPSETSAYNQVIIPTIEQFTKYQAALSKAGPLSQPISATDGFIIDMSLRGALLSYGRMGAKWSFATFGMFALKGEETPSMAELLIRGEAEHKRRASGEKTGDTYSLDDCPHAAIYVTRLADGGVGLIVSFKGTSNLGDWKRNLDLGKVNFGDSKDSKVHRGFYKHFSSIMGNLASWKLKELQQLLASWNVEDDSATVEDFILRGKWSWVICVGHSLGGAMADLAAEKIASTSNRSDSVYAVVVGAPVPGNKAFLSDMDKRVLPHGGLRIENPYDGIPWTGYGGVMMKSRNVNGIGWILPEDPSVSRLDKRGCHTFYTVETHEADGSVTCRFYTYQPFDAKGDPEATALQHYERREASFGTSE